jgi:prolyl-tRNA editing enzyme YbaK/EbsC (Cys-tRNA(Pro) deacylase)
MSEFSKRIKEWLRDNRVDAQVLEYPQSVHSVNEAVATSGYPVERFTKSIVMLTADDRVVIAMVPADSRASTERVRKTLNLAERPRVATVGEVEARLGQQIGGNSPLNAPGATILIDPRVLEREWILTGGGDNRTLIKIRVDELTRVVTYSAARVRK